MAGFEQFVTLPVKSDYICTEPQSQSIFSGVFSALEIVFVGMNASHFTVK